MNGTAARAMRGKEKGGAGIVGCIPHDPAVCLIAAKTKYSGVHL